MTPHLVRTQLRLPDELYQQLQKAVLDSGRSLNAELVWRLQQSFELPPPSPTEGDFDAKVIAAILRALSGAAGAGLAMEPKKRRRVKFSRGSRGDQGG